MTNDARGRLGCSVLRHNVGDRSTETGVASATKASTRSVYELHDRVWTLLLLPLLLRDLPSLVQSTASA